MVRPFHFKPYLTRYMLVYSEILCADKNVLALLLEEANLMLTHLVNSPGRVPCLID